MTQEDPILHQSGLLLKVIKDKTGYELHYDLFSLLNIDSLLTDLFGKGMEKVQNEKFTQAKNALTLQLACYYGECIRRSFWGEWSQDDRSGLVLRKVGGKEITLYPESTAYDRMNGDDAKIYSATAFVMSQIIMEYKPE